MLYHIKNANNAGYLMGTMHIQSASAYTYITQATQVMMRCKAFFAEVDLAQSNSTEIQSLFDLPEDQILSNYFSYKKYKKLKASIQKSFGIDIDTLERKLPFYTTNFLLTSTCDVDHPYPLDHQLYRLALQYGLDTGGLENLSDQSDIVSNIPLLYQLAQLKKLAQNPAKHKNKIAKLQKAYANNDKKYINQQSRKELGALRKVLLLERNTKMASGILDQMAKEPTFFAVGAAHLFGSKGILHALSASGVRCKQLI